MLVNRGRNACNLAQAFRAMSMSELGCPRLYSFRNMRDKETQAEFATVTSSLRRVRMRCAFMLDIGSQHAWIESA